MRIDVVTLFPDMVDAPLSESIMGRARRRGQVKMGFVNPRDFAVGRHRTTDDRPYGGGLGMIMMAEPLYQAVKSVRKRGSTVITLEPRGRKLDQKLAAALSKKKHIILVCGHYEGIDSRLLGKSDMELSIGDYILTGGEPAAVVVTDCIVRLLPGVLKKEEAVVEESFGRVGLLEAPQYTRPAVWRRLKVPEILLSGNHKKITEWRAEQAVAMTKKRRPDLMKATKGTKATKATKIL